MFDYLFKFTDEAEAKDVLASWLDEEGNWEASREHAGVLPTQIVRSDAVANEEGEIVTPREVDPAFWLVISLAERDAEIYAVPQCLQETQRPETTPLPVSATILQTKLSPESYSSFLRVDPTFAGAAYIWGA